MIKRLAFVTICSVSFLSACNNVNEAEVYEESGKTINVSDRNEIYNDDGIRNKDGKMENFGFVRHQKSPVPNRSTVYNMPKLDREVVADMISKMATQIDDVNEAATLVTDEEVLIVYDTNSNDRFEKADQVKKTALSVVPRYYHVYVSDNPRLMQDIERFGLLDSTSRNVDQIITSTIQEMKKSPQGRNISNGENANGEMEGGVNNEYERRMNDLPDNLQNPSTRDTENNRDKDTSMGKQLQKGTQ